MNFFFALIVVFLLLPSSSFAGGCIPGQDCHQAEKQARKAEVRTQLSEDLDAQAPHAEIKAIPSTEIPSASDFDAKKARAKFGISSGINVLYFSSEDTAVAPGVYADYQPAGLPVNFRVGVEGTGFDSEQHKYDPSSSYFNQEVDVNMFRIPLTAEVVVPLMEGTNFYYGGGADLIHLNGEVDDTDVGGHLQLRLKQEVAKNISVYGSGGYLFANSKRGEGRENLDLGGFYSGVYVNADF